MDLKKIKKIHIIGICGVATGSIAIALKKAGYEISGSDKGFFPPVSDLLKKENIKFYPGFHENKMLENGNPDLIIIGNSSGSQNPETLKARELQILELSDAEARGKFFSHEENIVCAGTWGKTSTSALLSFILLDNNLDPSYITGGISLSHDPAKIGKGKFSVIEGDEYKTSPFDNRPKFFHFPPKHLLLTSISWDHADLYKTENDFIKIFKDLISKVPKEGILAVSSSNVQAFELSKDTVNKRVTYGFKETDDYQIINIKESQTGLEFEIKHNKQIYKIKSPMLGLFQIENITGSFAMIRETTNLDPKNIIQSIKKFAGIKRRLQKRFNNKVTIIDDIAHSPEKAKSTLTEIRKIYHKKIIAIYEPNIGSRQRETIDKYDGAFSSADMVFIPRLTKLKISGKEIKPLEGDELTKIIKKTKSETFYEPNDEKLIERVYQTAENNDVIIFLGSHGFRGMIESLIEKIK